jgi:hypothetical protein
MRRDRAEQRAADLALTDDTPGMMYSAVHRGRNRWVVVRRIVKGDHYGAAEEVER